MIKDNILRIRERVASLYLALGRQAQEIIIVAVSKNRSAEEIKEALAAGITDIGENRVQEALIKYNRLRLTTYDLRLKWHMVGHLQTNKVKDAVKIFGLIHSVDSLRLAEEIDKQAAKLNKIQDILIEIKTSPEAAKFGLKPEEAVEVITKIAKLKNISIKGLMTVARQSDEPEESRHYFKTLKELFDKINHLRLTADNLRILSMGMTDDYCIAIEEGANMLRLGRAIFE